MLFVLKDMLNRIKHTILERFNFINCFLSGLCAYICCFPLYKFLYPICTYKNLNDFYVGTSIYHNHNKYLDVGIIFVYLIIFCIFYLIFNFKELKINFPITRFSKPIYIFSIILAFILLFSFRLETLPIIDPHHYGEKFATYWLHTKYGMKYYIDLMLVHGYLDVLPSFLADKLLGTLTFYNERLMNLFINYAILCFNLLLAFFVFRKRPLMMLLSSSVLCYIFHVGGAIHIYTFILVYILLLKNKHTHFVFYWNLSFLLISAFVMTYQTTIGTGCVVASLPLLFAHFKRNWRKNLIFWGISLLLIILFFHESILAYLNISEYYLLSNLYSFGNEFPRQISIFSFSAFSFFVLPILLLPVFGVLSLHKMDKEVSYLSIFVLILIFSTLSYSFGRIDSTANIPRLQGISLPITAIIIPYIILKLKEEYLDIYSILLTLIIYVYSLSNIITMPNIFVAGPSDNKITDTQINFVKSIVSENETVLDLTNNGMFYYFVNRKIAIPNTSFFNIVNSKQTEDILEILKINPPKLVRVYNLNKKGYFHDNVRIPERINKIYRWLFLSGLYEQKNVEGILYLIYKPKASTTLLDNIDSIGAENLEYLPDAWEASIKTLPLVKVIDSLKIDNAKIQVSELITPKESDLLFLDISGKTDSDFELKMNDLDSTLKFKTHTNKLLIPIDSYPTWLMVDKIESFELLSKDSIKVNKAVLYKRK